MKTHTKAVTFVAALAVIIGTAVGAQEKAPQERAAQIVIPVRVQVVLSRSQGEKKISSMPYTLSLNVPPPPAGGSANLRMGAKIPIEQTSIANGPTSFTYQDVGTNIDCNVTATDDGRYRVGVNIDDSSVYAEDQGKPGVHPSFRSFRASNSLVLRDGQTGQFTAATDKVSGEVTKVDVTLNVVK